jgi:hypothetical protein
MHRRLTAVGLLFALATNVSAQDKSSPVSINDPKAFQGYTLIPPLLSTKTLLVDMQGRVVKSWECGATPGLSAYLLENGHLLRPAKLKASEQFFEGAGTGGRIQEYTWDGELVWDFKFHSEKQLQHHDVCKMPNGNVLMLVWNKKTSKEAIEAGMKPVNARGPQLFDSVIEVKPTGKTTGEVVWEWYVADHLIQDIDKTKANFGDVAAHPELIDVNFGHNDVINGLAALFGGGKKDDAKKDTKKEELAKLKGIGYVGGKGNVTMLQDWPHLNCVSYNADLDQVMVSSRLMSEFWIIDHGTTTAEAAGHKGGKQGRGGDLLYRWGNPQSYRAGTAKEQVLFTQHNAHWIPKGLPGAGHVLAYNNGGSRPGGNFSTVDEIEIPLGKYLLPTGGTYEPKQALWSYQAPNKTDFYSWVISGTHRLPNGNTIVCEGMRGTIFEVTPDKEVVWKYKYQAKPTNSFSGPSKPGEVLAAALQDALKLSTEQKKQVAELQNDVDAQLKKALDETQQKELKTVQDAKTVVGGFPAHGQILTDFLKAKLKLTDEQKQRVDDLQKTINERLAKTLADNQKKQLKEAQATAARPFNFDFLGMGNAIFRIYRYGADYPGLKGRELKAE